MNFVYSEYETKTKMVQEQLLQLKKKSLLDYYFKIVIYRRRWTFGGGRGGKKLMLRMSTVGRMFPGWGMSKF